MEITPVVKIDKPQTDDARDIQLREASRKMEAAFLNYVFKTMEKTIPKTSVSGGSNNNLASMMFSSVMADAVSEQGGMGLGDQLYNSLKEMDEIPDFDKIQMDDISNKFNAMQLMKKGLEK